MLMNLFIVANISRLNAKIKARKKMLKDISQIKITFVSYFRQKLLKHIQITKINF